MMFVVAGGAVAHAMGMDLSSNFTLAAGTTNGQVTGPWAARSGFPNTVFASSKMVADGGTWTLNAKGTLTSGWSSATALQLFIMKNAAVFATLSIGFSVSSATLTPQAITLASGDTVWLAYTTPIGATGTLAAGAANTFVYFS
ncbi:hypothetical protein [Nocardia beijingensis]|uniref:hypothetical protein n=1 Tax=Nocardia beijingensis TaxID=95162 RepID=UPI00339F748F